MSVKYRSVSGPRPRSVRPAGFDASSVRPKGEPSPSDASFFSGGEHGDPAFASCAACRRGARGGGALSGAVRARQHHRRRAGHDQGRAARRVAQGRQHRHQRDDHRVLVGVRHLQRRQPAAWHRTASRPRSQGFQTAKVEGIRVAAGGTARIDVTLTPGAITESVNVVGRNTRGSDRGREDHHQRVERADRQAAARRGRRDAQRLRPRAGHRARSARAAAATSCSAADRAARSAPRSTASP